jgi:2-polyprenyl-3-methyl-5-hydroxy-6-metoxy-1,4-benzoquinol methylase
MKHYREKIYGRYLEARGDQDGPDERELRGRIHSLRRIVRRYFPGDRSISVVDLGCGYGAFVHVAQEAGYANVWGIDQSLQQVDAARRLRIAGVRHGDLQGTLRAQADETLDIVVMLDVIEHMTKPELAVIVDEVRRALRPGGKWIIHAPNAESPFFGRIRYGDFTHEQAFTCTSITQLLLASGFTQIVCDEDGPVIHGASSAMRWLVWRMIRFCLRIYLAAETGSAGRNVILTQNLFAVATK